MSDDKGGEKPEPFAVRQILMINYWIKQPEPGPTRQPDVVTGAIVEAAAIVRSRHHRATVQLDQLGSLATCTRCSISASHVSLRRAVDGLFLFA